MIANDILLDAFTRVYESLHRTLGDITPDELTKEPHPSIGWLAWRISRVMDNNVARLSGREQLWIGDGWAARFGMPPEPATAGPTICATFMDVEFSAAALERSSSPTR